MAITTNYIHNKFSLLTNPTFESLVSRDGILSKHQILSIVNLIGLLQIDTLEFTKDYNSKLEECKTFFNGVSNIENILSKLINQIDEGNKEVVNSRIENLMSFFQCYTFDKGIQYIKSSLNFLDDNSKDTTWRLYYADIWQVSYSLAQSKGLTLSQVEELNLVGLVTLPNQEKFISLSRNVGIFKSISSRFHTDLENKIKEIKTFYTLENIKDTIHFLNSLSNSEIKTLWQFVLTNETYGLEEEYIINFEPGLKEILNHKFKISRYINNLPEFQAFQTMFNLPSSIEENYYNYDGVVTTFLDLSDSIIQDTEIELNIKNESLSFIYQLSRLISICYREKMYPLNLIDNEKYLSAYDLILHFLEFTPIIFDVCDYDLTEFYEIIVSEDIRRLKKNIQTKSKSWDRTISQLMKGDLSKSFEIRYSKFKDIIDLKKTNAKDGDHQNLIGMTFELVLALGEVPGFKSNFSITVTNINKIISSLKSILKYIGEDKVNPNIDMKIHNAISTNLILLGYNITKKEFNKEILTNYLNGYYNFDAVNSTSVVEDLSGFII